MARRQFGRVRKLPSGRYQASFVDPWGRRTPQGKPVRHNAPVTYRNKTDARRWLSTQEADIARGTWVNDELGRQTFGDYAREHLRDSKTIGDRWRETCLRNLRLHLAPLDGVQLRALTPVVVRKWHAEALRGDGGSTSIAQSYRFMRTVLNAAVRENAIHKNPCNIPGAGADQAAERTVATLEEVSALVEAITPRYRAAVLLAAWCSLRRGEVIALFRDDVDLEAGTVTVRRNRVELLESPVAFDKAPKSPAGKRQVNIPPHVLPVLAEHIATWAGEQRVFVGRTGHPMRGDAVRQAFTRARRKVGMNAFTFHDLRHTGATLSAQLGATMKDLMRRLGHASEAAAKRYLHTVEGRDAEIAAGLSELAKEGNAAKLPRSITMRSDR